MKKGEGLQSHVGKVAQRAGVASLVAALGLLQGEALAECKHLTPFGEPEHWSVAGDAGVGEGPAWVVLCHTGQVVGFNPSRNVSDWAAYRLRREELLNPQVERKDSFRGDPGVSAEHRVIHADYTRSGFDRGHLAPAAAMRWSAAAMADSFLMSNIAPQVGAGFNQHIWKVLESKMRRWACERETLYVVTGPLYEERPLRKVKRDADGDGQDDNGIEVDVPSHYYKLAFDPVRVESIAFILENRRLVTGDLWKYMASIDEIEGRGRLDFLSELWDVAESAVENHIQPQLWPEPLGECSGID